jgi:hypothetical protein
VLPVLAGIIVVGIMIQFIPYGRDHPNPPVNAEPHWDTPATAALARRACFDCHSNETKWPWYSNIAPASWLVYRDVAEGRKHVNFSDWARTAEQHTDELQEVFIENSMPPSYYLWLHPEAALSAVERRALAEGLATLARGHQP